MTAPTVQLGFCIPIEDDEQLQEVAHRSADYTLWDGGQVGGKPSWLNPQHIPNSIPCLNCSSLSMKFVTQLYAPVDFPDDDRAFHRSLYLFACANCLQNKHPENKVIRILRAQLPANNGYFPNTENKSSDEVEEVNWQQHTPDAWTVNLCALCGVKGKGKCPLQQLYFCGSEHQKEYKRSGDRSILPLSQLVVEEEPPVTKDTTKNRKQLFSNVSEENTDEIGSKNDDDDDDDDDDEKQDGAGFDGVNGEPDVDEDLEQEDLNEMTGAATNLVSQDPITMKFYQRIQGRPSVRDQCLRYIRWSNMDPLWIQGQHRPAFIPPCENCGADRKFEFQLMPQMLHYLMTPKEDTDRDEKTGDDKYAQVKEALEQTESWVQQAPPEHIPPALMDARDSAIQRVQDELLKRNSQQDLDWGVVAVFTCTQSCNKTFLDDLGAYSEEFAWVQPSLDS
ncbi:pre-rRNA-processing protein TSR4 [Fistulifera solaris]|uniref:Pre-rRNA-processing protein TSR4 n=1 Tax=Fistulifera solaris TaxID=1519565 RepID=A0A1Z5KEP5_FISSO|nr:pre-rRNA-processing protein TSR4 [Fistulifera solaris]|eukprot:GAX24800.1 pre-rRNA-processing protein TSR4 [Fistulifera solaris]